jgi:hypothetical protein
MEDGAVGHNFEMGLHKDYSRQIGFNLVQRFPASFLSKLRAKKVEKVRNSS